MNEKTSVRLILRDQQVAAPPQVDPDGVGQCHEVVRILIWFHAQVGIGIDRQYAAMPEDSAYSMGLFLTTGAEKAETSYQSYWTFGLHDGLSGFYSEIQKIAKDPVKEARRSLAEDEPSQRKATVEKLKKLRQLANLKWLKNPEGHVRLRFHLDSIENPEFEIVFCKPEEFSHAVDLLTAEEEEETLTFNGKVSEIDEANGLLIVRTEKRVAIIQAPESLRAAIDQGKRTGFRVREKATTTKINVYVLLEILSDDSDDLLPDH